MNTPSTLPKTTLYCCAGGANKEYEASVVECPSGGGFLVATRHGPRGRATVLGTKTPVAVPLERAVSIYNKLVAEKTAKGYTPDTSGVAYADTPLAGRSSGWTPALLEPVDAFDESLEDLLRDSEWLAVEKVDGERRGIEVTASGVLGMNRRGLYVPVPAPWTAALSQLPVGTFLDGEQMGDTFFVFDALQIGWDDLRAEGYAARVAALHSAFLAVCADGSNRITLLPVVAGEHAKRALLQRVERSGGEGIVLRHRDSPYSPGRSSEARKAKFLESVSCLVSGINEGRRSVRVALALDSGEWREVGSVTVPTNHPMPAVGDVAEVRYMHLFEGGALYQPVYLCARGDLVADDCTLSQVKRIKLKSAADADAGAARFALTQE